MSYINIINIHSSGNQSINHDKNCINPQETWRKPPESWIKINIDASFRTNNTNAGFALIARDSTGRFLAAMAYSTRARDVNQAEALVMLRALHWIKEMQFQRVVIEGDNWLVINSCNGSVEGFKWEDQNIIKECQDFLQKLESCQVTFQKRSCNIATDKLAKLARTSIRYQIRLEEPPNVIASILAAESKN
ncbi:uncharacterized protein LOC113302165 [Papaver somniferum]|uniref:uncharacterized protein LOC113302165 n=1 Tax=Papaver somniferum TaxID=3469 RepID=UPI000E6F839E|nr:uncharacterized protein LOC113302165 [Papaver somniferum]